MSFVNTKVIIIDSLLMQVAVIFFQFLGKVFQYIKMF